MTQGTTVKRVSGALLIACMLIVSANPVRGQASINFANNSTCLVTNGITGKPVRAEEGFHAALFYGPLGAYWTEFVQSGAAVPVGKPVPGVFAGGTRLTDTSIAPHDSVQVQVRAWPAAFGRYEDAVLHGAAVGFSSVMIVTTGDAGSQPNVPPPSLVVDGFHGFAVEGRWNYPPNTTNVFLATAVNTPLSVDFSTIYAAATNGDELSICSVDSTSAQSASIGETASMIVYTPATNFEGNDTFSVCITDGRGGFAAVPVSVLVSGSWTPATNALSISCQGGHTVIGYAGAAGESYVIQYAPSVNGPWSDLSGSLTVGANLTMGYNDQNVPAASRFYRVLVKP